METITGCIPCPSLEQRNMLAIQRNTEAIASLTVSVQELTARDSDIQRQIDDWTTTLDEKIVSGYKELFVPDFEAEKTARENADAILTERVTAVEAYDATIPTTYSTKAELLAVKTGLEDEDIRLRTKIVTDVDEAKTALTAKIGEVADKVAKNTEDISANAIAITSEKSAREDADISIRTDVNATVGEIYTTLRGEIKSATSALETSVRNDFTSADATLEGRLSSAETRISSAETRISSAETRIQALETKCDDGLTDLQTKIKTTDENVSALDSRIAVELESLRTRVANLEAIIVTR